MKKCLLQSKILSAIYVFMFVLAANMATAQMQLSSINNGNWGTATIWETPTLTGSISTNTGSTAVTGTGTSFSTQLSVGAVLYRTTGTAIGTISSINSNTSITLTANASNNNTNAAFRARKVPAAGDVVTITNSDDVNVNVAAACASLTIAGGVTDTQLDINNGQSLTVSGAVAIGAGIDNGDDILLNVAAGTFSCASLTIDMAGSGNNTTNSELTISTGTATISGDITMNGSALRNAIRFSGAGTLNVGGNVAAGGDIVPSGTLNGQVNYNGTSGTQTVKADTYADITFSGGAAKQLAGAVTVTDVCTFTSGIVTSTSANLLTLNAAATVAGASDASFVDGPVRKVGAVGATAFNFPVGKTGTGYMTISIANVTGATTEFTAEYVRASAANTFGLTGLTALGIQAVSNCEFWTLDRAVTTSTADVTLSWNSHSPCGGAYLVDPLFGVRIVHYNTGTSSWDAQGGGSPLGAAALGSVTWTGVSAFSPFALGVTFGSQSPLPVMFSNVKAYQKNSGVQIDWSNLTERDLVSYIVERSANGQNFTTINQQAPRSNNNDKESYFAFDASPLPGINFYRIKVMEVSGKIIYSKVLKVDLGGKQKGFTLYPNPVFGGQVSVSMNVKQGQYTVKVLNSAGQQVYTQRLNHQGGSMTQTVDLPSSVKPGVYNMVISGDGYREAKMFIVQ
ncbi:MAG TPA: T9SS type A sorting domain-containing protein [Chitinophagaceae bacterium]